MNDQKKVLGAIGLIALISFVLLVIGGGTLFAIVDNSNVVIQQINAPPGTVFESGYIVLNAQVTRSGSNGFPQTDGNQPVDRCMKRTGVTTSCLIFESWDYTEENEIKNYDLLGILDPGTTTNWKHEINQEVSFGVFNTNGRTCSGSTGVICEETFVNGNQVITNVIFNEYNTLANPSQSKVISKGPTSSFIDASRIKIPIPANVVGKTVWELKVTVARGGSPGTIGFGTPNKNNLVFKEVATNDIVISEEVAEEISEEMSEDAEPVKTFVTKEVKLVERQEAGLIQRIWIFILELLN